jgi:glycerol-3-phosphate dehydrogenase
MTNIPEQSISFTNRTEFLTQLAKNTNESVEDTWDVIVIGGGIVGAGILHEATRRGFKSLLIEQKDFAWGTSSRSSKMVHGGLRYIAQGDIKLTKHSLQERERLLKEAPGLINKMGYYFVVRHWQFPGRYIMSILLSLYDRFAGTKDHKYFGNRETVKKFPTLNTDNLKGSCYYTDTVVDDARLVIRVLQESITSGAEAINYVKATTLIKDPETEQVIGVSIEDSSNNINKTKDKKLFHLKSSVIINATGAWADKLRSEVINEQRIRPLRGSHLIVSQTKIPVEAALTILHPRDKRPVFIFPWEGVTVIGTTDLDHHENLDREASISQDEISYLLQAVHKSFPSNKVSLQDIISTFSGIRPVISSDKDFSKQASKERRDHAIWADNALVTASGGKLTTFRLTAIEAMDAATPWLMTNHNNEFMQKESSEHVFRNLSCDKLFNNKAKYSKYDKSWLQRLIGRYGNNAVSVITRAKDKENLTLGNTQFCLAECRWAIKNETVIHLDDLLLRRTRLGLLLKQGAEELFAQLSVIFEQELGWDKAKWQDEVKRYNLIWQQNYYLPKPINNKQNVNL